MGTIIIIIIIIIILLELDNDSRSSSGNVCMYIGEYKKPMWAAW